MTKGLTDIRGDFAGWYTDVVQRAELADYAPVPGCMVIRPYGYELWSQMQRQMDQRIRATGHENAYFPLMIPESLLQKEAEHVQGFNTEGVRVTKAGGKPLEEELVLRFSSEAIINTMFAKWVHSWRDLPVLINQWANVIRWEMRPRLFLRTREFFWQEGHTAHATQHEAKEETLKMLEVYREFMETCLAISVVAGRKSEREKFAGALETYTVEGLMQDHRALQMGTSHFFGQGFARAFGIQFQSREGELEYAWTTSWGVSTRMVGGVIMAHGDAKGLVLPPKIAPIQAVIVPIWKSDETEKRLVIETAHRIRDAVPDIRIRVDDRQQYKPGYKFHEWEMKGVPVRVELGPRDVAKDQAVLADRLSGAKVPVALDRIAPAIAGQLESCQKQLLQRNQAYRREHTVTAASMDELVEGVRQKGGFVQVPWAGKTEHEEQIQQACRATLRCMISNPEGETSCIATGRSTDLLALFARAY